MQLPVAHIVGPLLRSSRATLQPPRWSECLPAHASHMLNYRSQEGARKFHYVTQPARCGPCEKLVTLHASGSNRLHTRNPTCTRFHTYRQFARLPPIARMSNASKHSAAVELRRKA